MPRKIKKSEWAFQPADSFENWFDIPGFEGKYEMLVNDTIRNKKTKEIVVPRVHKGSKEIKLYGRDGIQHTKSISSLHKETFDPERIKCLMDFTHPDPYKPEYEGRHYAYYKDKRRKSNDLPDGLEGLEGLDGLNGLEGLPDDYYDDN